VRTDTCVTHLHGQSLHFIELWRALGLVCRRRRGRRRDGNHGKRTTNAASCKKGGCFCGKAP